MLAIDAASNDRRGVDVAHYLLGVLSVALYFPTAKIRDVLCSGLGRTPSICLLGASREVPSHSFSPIRAVASATNIPKAALLELCGSSLQGCPEHKFSHPCKKVPKLQIAGPTTEFTVSRRGLTSGNHPCKGLGKRQTVK